MSSIKFRILIDSDGEEEIFRDILIDDSENFEVFYRSIIESFGFAGDQLASFYLSNDSWDKGHEIALMDMGMGESGELSIMSETEIKEYVDEKDQKLVLVYDFMKMWCFLIDVVEISGTITDQPEVVLSVGIAPDENSKELDFSSDMGMISPSDLGDDMDDIFSGSDDDDDEMEFENLDDFDI